MIKSTFSIRTFLLASVFLFALLSSYGQNESSDQVMGAWIKSAGNGNTTIVMTADNKYEVKFTGGIEPDVWGSYKLSGSKITFTDEGGEYSSGSSGVYEFKIGENSITFTKFDDPVDGRSMLVTGNWSKAELTEK